MPKAGTSLGSNRGVAPCSVQSGWYKIRADVQTADSGVLTWGTLDGTLDAIPAVVDVPDHATSFIARIAVTTDATTFTTDPVIQWVGVDAAGVPMRLDTNDNGGTGRTYAIDGSSTDYAYDSKYWSDYDAAPIDCAGCAKLYAVVATGSAYTDGATEQAVELWVKFLN